MVRLEAKREKRSPFAGFLAESQDENLAFTVLYVPYLLDSRCVAVDTSLLLPIGSLPGPIFVVVYTL